MSHTELAKELSRILAELLERVDAANRGHGTEEDAARVARDELKGLLREIDPPDHHDAREN